MAGNRESGLRAAETNRRRYGKDFYKRIGRKGGQASRGGGFALYPELASEAGRKGGKAKRRSKETPPEEQEGPIYEFLPGGLVGKALTGLRRVAERFSG